MYYFRTSLFCSLTADACPGTGSPAVLCTGSSQSLVPSLISAGLLWLDPEELHDFFCIFSSRRRYLGFVESLLQTDGLMVLMGEDGAQDACAVTWLM